MKHRPSNSERQLFRDAVKDVKPLRQERSLPSERHPPPRSNFPKRDRLALPLESADRLSAAGDGLVFRREGVADSVLRKLRRGQYPVQESLDLHGLTAAEAKQALREFIAEALSLNMRCVCIVHGKGLRSGHRGPVVKTVVDTTLRHTQAVLAFVSARSMDGGTGAVYVLLKSGVEHRISRISSKTTA